MKVMELASKQYKVEERAMTVDELVSAAEVFLTSTTKPILPVLTIDNKTVGFGKPGEITTSLYHTFSEMEKHLAASIVLQ
jgi:branched-subunit amino acid aminotransferase/4-amino-4-deoxychorismate lyase